MEYAVTTVISQCELWTDNETATAYEATNVYEFNNDNKRAAEDEGKYE